MCTTQTFAAVVTALRTSQSPVLRTRSLGLEYGSQHFALQMVVAVRVSHLQKECYLETNFALGEGVLTSPKYPGAYPNNYQQTQVLKAESGEILRLEFTDFHVNSQVLGTCRFDYVTITDGDGTLLMDKTCGQPPFLPPVIMTLTNTVEVHFYTDTNGAGYGWSLSWAAVTPGLFANSAVLAAYCITFPC